MEKLFPINIKQAHDRFFKMAMSDKRIAQAFFSSHLPEEIKQIVDLSQLELRSGSYVDDIRQETVADMLFRTKINQQDAYLYLVIDHQSTPDEFMPFRILKYTCNIISQYLKEHEKAQSVPFILPIVIYHGEEAWPYSNDINDLVAAPKVLVEQYFLKPFQLIDLNQIEDEKLKGNIWSGVMALTLKHIFSENIDQHLLDIFTLLKQIEMQNGQSFIEDVLLYLLDKAKIKDENHFIQLIKTQLSTDTENKMATLAERFRYEGWQLGKTEGRTEGKTEGKVEVVHQIAHKLLSAGQALPFVAEMTGLAIEELEKMKDQ